MSTPTIRVKMADPSRRLWCAPIAGFIAGDVEVDVPDVSFWRRRIKDGDMVIVGGGVRPARAAEVAKATAAAEAAKPKKSKPAAKTDKAPKLGSNITKAERFGDKE